VEVLDRATLSLAEYLTDIAANAPALLDASFLLYFLAEFGQTTWPFMAVVTLAARAHGSHTRVQGHNSCRGASREHLGVDKERLRISERHRR
jgi:hypothetical protein